LTDLEKRAAYAQLYGAGDIRIGLIVGRYPPLDYIAMRAGYMGPRGPPSPSFRPDDRMKEAHMFNLGELLQEVEKMPSLVQGFERVLADIEGDVSSITPILASVGAVTNAIVANTPAAAAVAAAT
jgi:hypothetical protein